MFCFVPFFFLFVARFISEVGACINGFCFDFFWREESAYSFDLESALHQGRPQGPHDGVAEAHMLLVVLR